jgi:hypothetical protein
VRDFCPALRSVHLHLHWTAADRGPEAKELAAPEVADAGGLSAAHRQQFGGALHVDFEAGACNQKVRRLGGDALGQLGEPLCGDHAGEPEVRI